ncbi:MAG: tetratricopeptide repeat protein [Gammaproteobacteria bacterium]
MSTEAKEKCFFDYQHPLFCGKGPDTLNTIGGECAEGAVDAYGFPRVTKDEGKAFTKFKEAADQGYAKAQYNLGLCYQYGIGTEKDEKTAVKTYQLAAAQGHVYAQYQLGVCYDEGRGVEQNKKTAEEYYQQVVEAGIKEIQSGSYSGHVLRAAHYFQLIANLGNADALYSADALYGLGVCYENGYRFTKDEIMAASYYQSAATKGHLEARYCLAQCYEKGTGVSQDKKEALRLYSLAAEGNHANAQYHLGEYYEKEKDVKKAVQYYFLAAENRLSTKASGKYIGQHYKQLLHLDALKTFKVAQEVSEKIRECSLAKFTPIYTKIIERYKSAALTRDCLGEGYSRGSALFNKLKKTSSYDNIAAMLTDKEYFGPGGNGPLSFEPMVCRGLIRAFAPQALETALLGPKSAKEFIALIVKQLKSVPTPSTGPAPPPPVAFFHSPEQRRSSLYDLDTDALDALEEEKPGSPQR